MRACPLILLLFLLLSFLTAAPIPGDYVRVRRSGVNIRTGASTDEPIIGQASKGQIYLYRGETLNWYIIELFSGEKRYISNSFAARLTEWKPEHQFDLPASDQVRHEMHQRVIHAIIDAEIEAERVAPLAVDAERHTRHRNILIDRNILTIFRTFEVHPALYRKLMAEALINIE